MRPTLRLRHGFRPCSCTSWMARANALSSRAQQALAPPNMVLLRCSLAMPSSGPTTMQSKGLGSIRPGDASQPDRPTCSCALSEKPRQGANMVTNSSEKIVTGPPTKKVSGLDPVAAGYDDCKIGSRPACAWAVGNRKPPSGSEHGD